MEFTRINITATDTCLNFVCFDFLKISQKRILQFLHTFSQIERVKWSIDCLWFPSQCRVQSTTLKTVNEKPFWILKKLLLAASFHNSCSIMVRIFLLLFEEKKSVAEYSKWKHCKHSNYITLTYHKSTS